MLKTKAQQDCISCDLANSHPYFGTVLRGGGNKTARKGWDVQFDSLPHEENIIENVSRNKLTVLSPGEEENTSKSLSQAEQLEHIEHEEDEKKKKTSPMLQSQREFAAVEKGILKSAKVFTMKYGEGGPEDYIEWEVLGDQEHHRDTTFSPPTSSNVIHTNFKYEAPIEDNFFEHVFPSIVGHAKIIDKFLWDPCAPFHGTAVASKIRFHDPEDPDPDWKVKQCYFLLIAAATERECGIENLWK